MMNSLTVTQLRQAGFSDEHIINFTNSKRPFLKGAGFSDSEINDHFGIAQSSWDMFAKSQVVGQDRSLIVDTDGDQLSVKPKDENATLAEVAAKQDNNLVTKDNQIVKPDGVTQPDTVSADGQPVADTQGKDLMRPENVNQPTFNTNLAASIAEAEKNKPPVYKWEDLTDVQKRQLKMGGSFWTEDASGKTGGSGQRISSKDVLYPNKEYTQREEEAREERFSVLNTLVSSGPSTLRLLDGIQKTNGFTDFQIDTINEALSFVSAIESDNKNILNEMGNKGGVFQIRQDEMVSLINRYVNLSKQFDPSFVKPDWVDKALEDKRATSLPLDAQRALMLTKMFTITQPAYADGKYSTTGNFQFSELSDTERAELQQIRVDVGESVKAVVEGVGDRNALLQQIEAKKAEIELVTANPAITIGEIQRQQVEILKLDEALAHLEKQYAALQLRLDKQSKLAYDDTDAGAEADFNNAPLEVRQSLFELIRKDKRVPDENAMSLPMRIAKGDPEAIKEFYLKYHNPPNPDQDTPALTERVDKYLSKWNTVDYKYELPQMATWSQDGWVTEFAKDSYAGRKFIKYSGGAGEQNVFGNGMNLSVSGLMSAYHYEVGVNGKDPRKAYEEIFMHQSQDGMLGFSQDVAKSMSQILGDTPWMGVGCAAAVAPPAVGMLTPAAPAVAPTLPFFCAAGAFALPESMRDTYIRGIMNGEVNNFDEFQKEFMSARTAEVAGKYGVVGAVTMGAGKGVQAMGGGRLLQLSAEVPTMVTLSAVLEGHVPTRQDFAHAAVLMFGIHGAVKGTNALYQIYKRHGVHPRDVVTLAEAREDIAADLAEGRVPRYFTEVGEALLNAAEETTGTKLIPPPKVEVNQTVKTSVAGTETGKVVGREQVDGAEAIISIEKPNGEVIKVGESKVEPSNSEHITVEITPEGQVRFGEVKETNFEARKAAGEFDADVILLDEIVVKAPKVDVAVDTVVKKQEQAVKWESDDAVGTVDVWVKKEVYPELTAEFKNKDVGRVSYEGKEASAKIKSDIIGRVEETTKVDVVYGIEKGGPSGMTEASTVVRAADGYYVVPREMFEALRKYTDPLTKEVKDADVGFSEGNIVFIAKDSVTGKTSLIGSLHAKKAEGKVEAQASSYYTTHMDSTGKTWSRENSTKGGSQRKIPDEPNQPPPFNGELNWKGLFEYGRGLDTFDLVELTRALIDHTPFLENLKEGYYGYFQYGGIKGGKVKQFTKEELKVVVNRALQENPKQFIMTLAHEIGHLIDYLPQETMNKGNILGSLAAIKDYLNKWIDGRADGAKPLTKVEIEALRKEAEAEALAKEPVIDAEITGELAITPKKILDIWKDPDIRSKIDPEFYSVIQGLSNALKKQVTRSAMKGMIDPHIKAIVDKINGKKNIDPDVLKKAEDILAAKVEKEIKERGLVSREEIMAELKALTQEWKPFDDAANPNFTAYRYSPRELMADFMMAFMLRPQWTKVNAPKAFEVLMNHFHKRPEVMQEFLKIQNALNAGGDKMFAPIHTATMEMMRSGSERVGKKMIEDAETGPSVRDAVETEFIDVFGWFYRRFGGPNGFYGSDRAARWFNEATMYFGGMIEKFRYRHAYMQSYQKAMMREVFEPLNKSGKSHDVLGTMLLYRNLAFSIQRGGKANPLGLWSQMKEAVQKDAEGNPELVRIVTEIEGGRDAKSIYENFAKLHPDVDALATKFFEIRAEYMHPVLKDSMMFDAETLQKMLDNNEYITFSVSKWVEKKIGKYGNKAFMSAHIKRTEGTLSDILNPLHTTLEKDFMLLTALKKNRLIIEAVKWMQDNKSWMETFDMNTKLGGSKKDVVIEKAKSIGKGVYEPPPKGMHQIMLMRNGKVEMWNMNKFAADAFLDNPYRWIMGTSILASTNAWYRGIFTEYNPLFWGKNMFKDTGRAVRNLENARYFDILKGGKNAYVKYLIKSIVPTWKSIFGDGTNLTNLMEKEGYLIAAMEGYRGQAGELAIRRMVKDGTLTADNVIVEKLMQKLDPKKYETFYSNTMGRMLEYVGNIARVLERMHKVAGKMYLDDAVKRGELKMSDMEILQRVQADVGSPSFLRTARMHPIMNNVFLFSNAMKEGIRGDYVRVREDPVGTITKMIAYNAAPKMLQKMAKYGFLGTAGLLFYAGVSEWDEQNYIIIPLGFTPEGKPIYFRIPQDETARIMNGVGGRIMDSIFADADPMEIMRGFSGDVSPQFAPIMKAFSDVYGMVFEKRNPINNLTGEYAIDQTTWEAQDMRTFLAAAKYMWNTNGPIIIHKFETNDIDKITSELEDALGFPIAGEFANTFLKVGQHPVKAEYYNKIKPMLDRDRSRESLDYREGVTLLLEGKADQLTVEQNTAIIRRASDLLNNDVLQGVLAKRLGGTELMQMLLTTDGQVEQTMLIGKILEFAKKNPDFPLLTTEK